MRKQKILVCIIATNILLTVINFQNVYAKSDNIIPSGVERLNCIKNNTYNELLDVNDNTEVKQRSILTDKNSGIIVHKSTKMYTITSVNVRKRKTTKSKRITTLDRGKTVTIIDKSNKKWQKIEYRGQIRYIHSDYLSMKKPQEINVKSIKLHGLSNTQKQRAYTIAEICVKEWKQYGVLPSVAIAQAMQESTLGKHCNGNNLWGIKSGAVYYDSLESGVYGYLKVINNGCYGTAPFTKNASSQISKILAGGYCTPVGDYYSNVMWIINKYGLERFDSLID